MNLVDDRSQAFLLHGRRVVGAVACSSGATRVRARHRPARSRAKAIRGSRPLRARLAALATARKPVLQGLGTDVRCNLDIKGQVAAEHFLSLAWYGDCAYVNGLTATTVIDASDTTNPRVVTTLTTPGMQSNWETMKVHERRGLLVGYQSNVPILDVYDVKADCKAPVLKKSYNLGGQGHAGNFSPDGTIYYASSLYTATVYAVDLHDPANPSVITSNFERMTHDLFVGKDGTRGYFVFSQLGAAWARSRSWTPSQVQARAANATGTLISEITWPDGYASQYPIPITLPRPGLPGDDRRARLRQPTARIPKSRSSATRGSSTSRTRQNPTLVSKIKTEAQDPANCVEATAQAGNVLRSGHALLQRRSAGRSAAALVRALGGRCAPVRHPQSVATEGTGVLQRTGGAGAGAHADPRRRARDLGIDDHDVLRAHDAGSRGRSDPRGLVDLTRFSTDRRRARAAASSPCALLVASTAGANGRMPGATEVSAAAAPDHLVVRATFGLIQTFDGGKQLAMDLRAGDRRQRRGRSAAHGHRKRRAGSGFPQGRPAASAATGVVRGRPARRCSKRRKPSI